MLDLWSAEYFNTKTWERVQEAQKQPPEKWEEARERYIEHKIKPLIQLYQESDHQWFKDARRRKGEVMHSSDLIAKLQRLNPHIAVHSQTNFPDDWGLYSAERGRIQFLTGMPKGWMTEWSYSIVDDRDLPTEERRGWRTVLVYLLLKDALTWKQVLAEFGEPQDGFNDTRWQAVTADIRLGNEQTFQRNVANAME